MKFRLHVSAFALFAVTSPAFAQDAVADNEGDDRDTIIVTGRAEKLYRVEETSVGKLPTQPLDSSQSVSVITDELIRDQGARDAQNLYRNISGVSLFSYAGVTARGFRQEENFYDGLRGDPYQGFAVPQLFNIERVEFLKGPAGMLYGQTAPGGLFNYVTKKPEFTAKGEARIIGGTRSRYGGSVEYTAPITENIAGRIAGFYEDRNQQRYNADSNVLLLDAGLAFNLGFGTLTAQATRYDIDLGGNRLRGVPVDDDGNFLASRRWNHNEDSDFLRLKSNTAQMRFDSQITPNLHFDLAARYIDATEKQEYHEPSGLIDADSDGVYDGVTREFRKQRRDNEGWSFGTNAVWTLPLQDGLKNRVLVGADHYFNTFDFDSWRARGGTTVQANLPTPLTFDDPQYGVTNSAEYDLTTIGVDTITKTKRTGFYALDELTIGKLILTGGVRYDHFRDIVTAGRFSDSAWTYRLGAVYKIQPDISVYVQHATSFEPQSVSSQDPLAGGPFKPTKGDIYEAGIKTELFGGKVQSGASIYQIRRRNLLQSDPRGDVDNDGVDDFISFGEVTSKGFDFDIAADITPDWVATLAYGYNDTKISEDNGLTNITNSVGNRFANAPKHQLGFWTRYQMRPIGLALALGGDYVSKRISLSGQPVKPYMVFDASLIWERGPYRALLRVDNIFDKTYAASGFSDRSGHFPGEPRSAFVELSYKF